MLESQKLICFLFIAFGLLGPQQMISQRIHFGSAKNVKSTAFDPKSETLYGIFQDSVVAFSGFQMNNRKA
ncbi:MAG: hypothetical protein RLZZ241_2312 [Bacteroidota bacterium]|jgi:hypothetical protein